MRKWGDGEVNRWSCWVHAWLLIFLLNGLAGRQLDASLLHQLHSAYLLGHTLSQDFLTSESQVRLPVWGCVPAGDAVCVFEA